MPSTSNALKDLTKNSRAEEPKKQIDTGCKAFAKNGKPCRAAATPGGLCFFHANPSRASELGRIGGLNKGHSKVESIDPLPRMDNILAIKDSLARVIDGLYSGRISLKTAVGLSRLMDLQIRVIETVDLDRRIAKVEKVIEKEKALVEEKEAREHYEKHGPVKR